MNKKIVWFDGRNLENEDVILPLIYNNQFEYLLIDREKCNEIKCPHKMKIIVEVDKKNFEDINKEHIILSRDISLLNKVKASGRSTAYYTTISNQDEMESAWQLGMEHDFLVVDIPDPTNIPLELLVARLQNSHTRILKKVSSLVDMKIAFGVMEVGSQGVLLASESIDEILGVNKYMSTEKSGKLELIKGKVIDVQHIGMGNRVCIDTTSIMNNNEGMIVGSTSNGGLLVSSETHYLPYMELRPFRVNAGAIHSYVWVPDGMTKYLTELKGGTKVLSVDTEGKTREISVGRIKVEVRPLLKIEVEAKGIHVNAIVQDDWHIRIFGADGKVRNASNIQIGDELMTYICESGRHVGIKIDEVLHEV